VRPYQWARSAAAGGIGVIALHAARVTPFACCW